MSLIALYETDLVIQPWMTFVAYQGLNILTSSIVMFGNRFIPLINKFSCEMESQSVIQIDPDTNHLAMIQCATYS